MQTTVLSIHALMRWLVLLSLLLSIYRSYKGYFFRLPFSKTDNAIRHWTATIAHVQLVLGIVLYAQSPIIRYFWGNLDDALQNNEALFFGFIHLLLMITAIALLTIGSAMAKRKADDRDKYKTILIWFTCSLAIILVAIPWPFSPLASRPYLRIF